MENRIKFKEATIKDGAGDPIIIRTDGEDVFLDCFAGGYYFSPSDARALAAHIHTAAESLDGVAASVQAAKPLGSAEPPKWTFDGRVRAFGPAEIVPKADGHALFVDKRKVTDFDADTPLATVKAAAEAHVNAPMTAPRTWLVTVCGVAGVTIKNTDLQHYVYVDGSRLPSAYRRERQIGSSLAVWQVPPEDIVKIAQLTGPPEVNDG